jgi:hypothetical protein
MFNYLARDLDGLLIDFKAIELSTPLFEQVAETHSTVTNKAAELIHDLGLVFQEDLVDLGSLMLTDDHDTTVVVCEIMNGLNDRVRVALFSTVLDSGKDHRLESICRR